MAKKKQNLKYKTTLIFTGRPSKKKEKKELNNLSGKTLANKANMVNNQL